MLPKIDLLLNGLQEQNVSNETTSDINIATIILRNVQNKVLPET